MEMDEETLILVFLFNETEGNVFFDRCKNYFLLPVNKYCTFHSQDQCYRLQSYFVTKTDMFPKFYLTKTPIKNLQLITLAAYHWHEEIYKKFTYVRKKRWEVGNLLEDLSPLVLVDELIDNQSEAPVFFEEFSFNDISDPTIVLFNEFTSRCPLTIIDEDYDPDDDDFIEIAEEYVDLGVDLFMTGKRSVFGKEKTEIERSLKVLSEKWQLLYWISHEVGYGFSYSPYIMTDMAFNWKKEWGVFPVECLEKVYYCGMIQGKFELCVYCEDSFPIKMIYKEIYWARKNPSSLYGKALWSYAQYLSMNFETKQIEYEKLPDRTKKHLSFILLHFRMKKAF
jgi:hypothetical protein